jgi:hypothetical protein
MKFQFWAKINPEDNNKVFQNFLKFIKNLLYGEKIDITIEITETKKKISDEQRGYMWAEVIPSIKQGLIELGNDIPHNKKTGDEFVYQYLKAQGGFFDIKKITLASGEVHTFAEFETFGMKGDKRKLTEFIDFCIRFASEKLGVVVRSPEEWKLERGIK